MRYSEIFGHAARGVSRTVGHPVAFALALGVVLAWLITGPLFGFSDTWQLVINTATTVVTFLMVFLIQNTQYRESVALQVKIDELIRAIQGAHNSLLDLEELDPKDLDRLRERYEQLAKRSRQEVRNGGRDEGSPEVR